jgi:hypothetical protein
MAAIKQEANAPLIITVGVVSAMMVLIVMIGIHAWFIKEERDEIEAKWEMNKNAALVNLRTGQEQRLSNYAWTDKEKQTVAIPIDEAVKNFVQRGGILPTTQPKNK